MLFKFGYWVCIVDNGSEVLELLVCEWLDGVLFDC